MTVCSPSWTDVILLTPEDFITSVTLCLAVGAPVSPHIPDVDHLLAVIQPQEPLQIFSVGLKCCLL